MPEPGFPSRHALEYMGDYKKLTEINVLASKHFRDERLSMKGIPPKLRAIADEYLESRGIDQKVPPISIMDEDFQRGVAKHTRTKTKTAEVEHAIRHYLDVELDDDPDLQASFSQALEEIFRKFRDNWDEIYHELENLRVRIINASKEPTFGLNRKKQMPFFRSMRREVYGESKLDEDAIALLVSLTQKLFLVIDRELRLTGFWESLPARNKLKAEIQKVLLDPEFKALHPILIRNRNQIISRIMEIAQKNNDIILFAEE